MDLTSTDFLAIWGAVVATIALAWNIVISVRNVPRLRITNMPVSYLDGRLISEETTESGTIRHYADYEHIEIANFGKMPTTIISVHLESRKPSGIAGITAVALTWHFGKSLPILLGSGEMCSCRIEEKIVNSIKKDGRAFLVVNTSHKVKPIRYVLDT